MTSGDSRELLRATEKLLKQTDNDLMFARISGRNSEIGGKQAKLKIQKKSNTLIGEEAIKGTHGDDKTSATRLQDDMEGEIKAMAAKSLPLDRALGLKELEADKPGKSPGKGGCRLNMVSHVDTKSSG